MKLRIWCYKSASLTTNGSTNEALESDIEREEQEERRRRSSASIISTETCPRGVDKEPRREELYVGGHIPLDKSGRLFFKKGLKGASFVLVLDAENFLKRLKM